MQANYNANGNLVAYDLFGADGGLLHSYRLDSDWVMTTTYNPLGDHLWDSLVATYDASGGLVSSIYNYNVVSLWGDGANYTNIPIGDFDFATATVNWSGGGALFMDASGQGFQLDTSDPALLAQLNLVSPWGEVSPGFRVNGDGSTALTFDLQGDDGNIGHQLVYQYDSDGNMVGMELLNEEGDGGDWAVDPDSVQLTADALQAAGIPAGRGTYHVVQVNGRPAAVAIDTAATLTHADGTVTSLADFADMLVNSEYRFNRCLGLPREIDGLAYAHPAHLPQIGRSNRVIRRNKMLLEAA